MHRLDRLTLPAASPGARHELLAHRFGTPGARPKAYLQASLHADETPALLVAHHLLGLLEAADAAGAIRGEVVLVPYANPIGLGQALLGSQIGRFALDGGGNFNRGFPDLADAVAAAVDGRLGADAAANVGIVRAALADAVQALPAASEQEHLRRALLGLGADSDIVIDLHSDQEALLHLYLPNWIEEPGRVLAADLGVEVAASAEVYGNFDHSCGTLWLNLGRRFGPARPVPPACFVATIELRGRADVSDPTARADAEAILRFLKRQGVVAGDPGPLPAPRCAITPYDAVVAVAAPAAGVVTYPHPLGAELAAGAVVAEIVDPAAADAASGRIAVRTPVAGRFFTRRQNKLVRPGDHVAKIAGTSAAPGGNRKPIGV